MMKKFQIGQCVLHTSTGQKMFVVDYHYSLIISVSSIYGEKKDKVFTGQLICNYVPKNSNLIEIRITLNQNELEACKP